MPSQSGHEQGSGQMPPRPPGHATAAKASSGIEALDIILGGGYPRNRLHVIEGGPGVGKTTLGIQFLLHGLALDEKCFYVTLSETREELLAIAQSHGWSLDDIHFHELTSAGKLAHPKGHQTVFSTLQVELAETMEAFLDEVEKVGPSLLVFDSVSELRLLAGDMLSYRRQILHLKDFFEKHQCTVLLLDDLAGGDSEGQLQALVHSIVILEQLAPEFGVQQRRLRVEKMRGVSYRGGYHDFTIRKGGVVVYPRLVAAEHRTTFRPQNVSSGIAALDDLSGGGLSAGTACLLIGPAGVGKTTVSVQYALAAAERGEKAAIYMFDERLQTLYERCSGLGMQLQPHVAAGRISMQQIDPAEMTPGEFTHNVRAAVDGGVRTIVIDSLTGYLTAMAEGRYVLLQLHELLSFLGQRGATTMIVFGQHGLLNQKENNPTIDISYLADTVLHFGYYLSGGSLKKWIMVFKKRSGPHTTTFHDLSMSETGVTIGDALPNIGGHFPLPAMG